MKGNSLPNFPIPARPRAGPALQPCHCPYMRLDPPQWRTLPQPPVMGQHPASYAGCWQRDTGRLSRLICAGAPANTTWYQYNIILVLSILHNTTSAISILQRSFQYYPILRRHFQYYSILHNTTISILLNTTNCYFFNTTQYYIFLLYQYYSILLNTTKWLYQYYSIILNTTWAHPILQ